MYSSVLLNTYKTKQCKQLCKTVQILYSKFQGKCLLLPNLLHNLLLQIGREMLAYSCAEGVLENADRILGKHIAKTGMDYVNNALRGTLENPERTPKKNWIGSLDRHFFALADPIPIRIFCSYRRPIRSEYRIGTSLHRTASEKENRPSAAAQPDLNPTEVRSYHQQGGSATDQIGRAHV